MANTSLPNLTERTATASSDLIHVNSGGTDYKETKANFLSDVNSSITSLNNSLARTSFELTAVSPYTISRQQCYKIGNLCVVSILFNVPSSAPTVSGEVQIATVPEGFRSTDITYGCAIATSGVASYFYVSGSQCKMSPSCINAKTYIIVNLAYTV